MSLLSVPRSPLEKISSPLKGEQVVVMAGNCDESWKFPTENLSKEEVERAFENLGSSAEVVEAMEEMEERGSDLVTVSVTTCFSVGVVVTVRAWSGLATLLTLVKALLCT